MSVIDVHTHMISDGWLALLESHGQPHYTVGGAKSGRQAIHIDGAPFMNLTPPMADYDLRIRDMDAARVDLAIVSLTCPNVYWGGPEVSAGAARLINDSMADAQSRYPARIRWLASLPWEYPDRALAELDYACARGAVGVMVIATVANQSLTDERFAPIWRAIDARGLPVLCHPGPPPGLKQLDMERFSLVATVGFCMDTTLAVARMIYAGFFDTYSNLRLIAAHGGGTLPYLAGRLDAWYEKVPDCSEVITEAPSDILRRVYFDTVVYRVAALRLCLEVAGPDNLLYGSDYPHLTGDMVGCLRRVNELPQAVARQVAGQNAVRIFRL